MRIRSILFLAFLHLLACGDDASPTEDASVDTDQSVAAACVRQGDPSTCPMEIPRSGDPCCVDGDAEPTCQYSDLGQPRDFVCVAGTWSEVICDYGVPRFMGTVRFDAAIDLSAWDRLRVRTDAPFIVGSETTFDSSELSMLGPGDSVQFSLGGGLQGGPFSGGDYTLSATLESGDSEGPSSSTSVSVDCSAQFTSCTAACTVEPAGLDLTISPE